MFGAEFRRVEHREHLGKPALVIIAIRTFDTTVEDLWEAITTPERIARWFGSVEGELRLGGRYHIKGNASGSIIRCDPPEAVDLTWEAAPAASLDHDAFDAWTRSTSEGKAFARGSGEAWGAADAASGEDPAEARARAERTIAFYTGA